MLDPSRSSIHVSNQCVDNKSQQEYYCRESGLSGAIEKCKQILHTSDLKCVDGFYKGLHSATISETEKRIRTLYIDLTSTQKELSAAWCALERYISEEIAVRKTNEEAEQVSWTYLINIFYVLFGLENAQKSSILNQILK